MAHTPLPWTVRKVERDGKLRDVFVQAEDVNGYPYKAEILGDDEYREQSGGIARKLADCNLIVRAVNSHDALVDALTEARKWIDGQPARSTCKYTTQFELEEAIDNALARDGGTK
jgi:hypothetical protein